MLLLLELERRRAEARELFKLSWIGLVLMPLFWLIGHDMALIAIPVTAGFTLAFVTVGGWRYCVTAREIRELKQPARARLLKG